MLLALALASCGSAKLFRSHPVPESPSVAEAPWPRLVDTPVAPPKGTYSIGVPDPAVGVATIAELGIASRAAAERAEGLSGHVLSESDTLRLKRNR